MEKWQTRLRLKFGRSLFKVNVGFDYEWKAWLIAYDSKGMEPEEFSKIPFDQQVNTLAYAAAVWHCMKNKKKIFFNKESMAKALLRASQADNLKLVQAMTYSRFPDWLKNHDTDSDDKKKEEI